MFKACSLALKCSGLNVTTIKAHKIITQSEKGRQIRVQQLHPDGKRNRNVAETGMAKPRTKTC